MKRSLALVVLAALALASCSPTPEVRRAPEEYDEAIRLGSEWFLNNQNENFLYYAYYESEDRYSSSTSPFREMATLWVVAVASNYLDDPRLRELAKRGFAYFETHFEQDPSGDFLYVNIEPDRLALGYSAFAILTLLEIEHPRREEYLEQFANGILSSQEFTGKYRTYFFSDLDANQDYFPGEVCLALMSLYEETRDERVLQSVKRAFLYYSEYWEDRRSTAFASWHIQAHERLHQVTNYEAVRDFVFDMADFLIRDQKPEEHCTGFTLNGVFVASRLEGMNRAYKLARDVGDSVRMQCYGNYIREASDYLVDLQFTDPTAHPEAAIGGFPARKEPKLRVDRNQHVIAALIEARRLGALD